VGAGADCHGLMAEAYMNFILYLAAGLALVAAPAKADDTAKSSAQVQSDSSPRSPDRRAKADRHWAPDHVEANERSSAQVGAASKKKAGRNETTEVHRKVEKRSDGSTHSEIEKTHVYDPGSGETTDHEKTVVDSKSNDSGGRTITRDVTREHDAPGSANDHKTHAKEKIEKDANGNVVDREKSE
jgi:hypothetical protein